MGSARYGTVRVCVLAVVALLAMAPASRGDGPAGFWLDLYQGEPAPSDTVLADLVGADVVYLGETHTIARHHALQGVVIGAFAEAKVPFCLALEQMERVYQPQLDRYNRGEADLETTIADTQWEKRWTNIRDYVPLIERAHAAGAPIVALNARMEVVRKLGRGGIGSLTAEERAELPERLRFEDEPYRRLLGLKIGVHSGMPAERLAPMCDAQIVRDETMADSLTKFLAGDAGRGRKAVVLAGAGHVSFGLGLPERVRDRNPEVRDRVVLFTDSGELELSAADRAMAQSVSITHDDLHFVPRPMADYLNVKPPAE